MDEGVKCINCKHVRRTGEWAEDPCEEGSPRVELVECGFPLPVVARWTPGGAWYPSTVWVKCAQYVKAPPPCPQCESADCVDEVFKGDWRGTYYCASCLIRFIG